MEHKLNYERPSAEQVLLAVDWNFLQSTLSADGEKFTKSDGIWEEDNR